MKPPTRTGQVRGQPSRRPRRPWRRKILDRLSFLLLSTLPFRDLGSLFSDLLLTALRGLFPSGIPSLSVYSFRITTIGALRTIGGLLARTVVVDHEVLTQGHQVRGDPVHEQPGGEVEQKQGK